MNLTDNLIAEYKVKEREGECVMHSPDSLIKRWYNRVSTSRIETIISTLNSTEKIERLHACKEIGKAQKNQQLTRTVLQEVNNHVHTIYSFSPYSPSMAAFKAWEAGLTIVGSVDHDSISASREMKEASAFIGIASTTGFELRVSFKDTPFSNKKINNPDSTGIVYMVIHGVPLSAVDHVKEFLLPVQKMRSIRNKKQVDALNTLIAKSGIPLLDFEKDVVPLSMKEEGGSITERHILFALAKNILNHLTTQEKVVEFLMNSLDIEIPETLKVRLLDTTNEHFLYDLLGLFKSAYLEKFFIQPNREEILDVKTVVNFALSIGAIPSYAYLGDISSSVTGDKKSEQFEDAYLDELIAYIATLGFPAVTYMPPRNSVEQMRRLQTLCKKHNLMEISGVDINSSRQSFNCPEMLTQEAIHLVSSAWALVAHELLVDFNSDWGLFSPKNPVATKTLDERITLYAEFGKKMDPFNPSSIIPIAKMKLEGETE